MKIKRIVLIDPLSTGHHIEYAKHAIEAAKKANLDVTLICDEKMKDKLKLQVDEVIILSLDVTGGFLSREWGKIKYIVFLYKILNKRSVNIVHFLYLDRFIRAIIWLSTKSETTYLATCHWYYMLPEFNYGLGKKIVSLVERFLLKVLSYKNWKVISHSRFASKKLFGNDDYVLNYPVDSFPDVGTREIEHFRRSLGLNGKSVLMLCFGGTRYDKGADISVEVLSKLDDNHHLIIAGKKECISFESLRKMALDYGCNNRIHLIEGFVSDYETSLFFNSCDIVFIPYRKVFSGQSGPLTIGASMGKYVVSSNSMILKETVDRFSLGAVFEAENVVSAVNEINNYVGESKPSVTMKFNEAHTKACFVEGLSNLYLKSV